MAKKKGRGWHGDSKRHSIAAKKGSAGGSYVQRTTTPGARKRAGSAFKKAYKESRSFGSSKSFSKRQGMKAAAKAAPSVGKKRARTYAKKIAGSHGITSKSGRKQFAAGFVRSLKW